ncbi:hypothetical protein PCE1_004427 [Barthelona sp. PCE]
MSLLGTIGMQLTLILILCLSISYADVQKKNIEFFKEYTADLGTGGEQPVTYFHFELESVMYKRIEFIVYSNVSVGFMFERSAILGVDNLIFFSGHTSHGRKNLDFIPYTNPKFDGNFTGDLCFFPLEPVHVTFNLSYIEEKPGYLNSNEWIAFQSNYIYFIFPIQSELTALFASALLDLTINIVHLNESTGYVIEQYSIDLNNRLSLMLPPNSVCNSGLLVYFDDSRTYSVTNVYKLRKVNPEILKAEIAFDNPIFLSGSGVAVLLNLTGLIPTHKNLDTVVRFKAAYPLLGLKLHYVSPSFEIFQFTQCEEIQQIDVPQRFFEGSLLITSTSSVLAEISATRIVPSSMSQHLKLSFNMGGDCASFYSYQHLDLPANPTKYSDYYLYTKSSVDRSILFSKRLLSPLTINAPSTEIISVDLQPLSHVFIPMEVRQDFKYFVVNGPKTLAQLSMMIIDRTNFNIDFGTLMEERVVSTKFWIRPTHKVVQPCVLKVNSEISIDIHLQFTDEFLDHSIFSVQSGNNFVELNVLGRMIDILVTSGRGSYIHAINFGLFYVSDITVVDDKTYPFTLLANAIARANFSTSMKESIPRLFIDTENLFEGYLVFNGDQTAFSHNMFDVPMCTAHDIPNRAEFRVMIYVPQVTDIVIETFSVRTYELFVDQELEIETRHRSYLYFNVTKFIDTSLDFNIQQNILSVSIDIETNVDLSFISGKYFDFKECDCAGDIETVKLSAGTHTLNETVLSNVFDGVRHLTISSKLQGIIKIKLNVQFRSIGEFRPLTTKITFDLPANDRYYVHSIFDAEQKTREYPVVFNFCAYSYFKYSVAVNLNVIPNMKCATKVNDTLYCTRLDLTCLLKSTELYFWFGSSESDIQIHTNVLAGHLPFIDIVHNRTLNHFVLPNACYLTLITVQHTSSIGIISTTALQSTVHRVNGLCDVSYVGSTMGITKNDKELIINTHAISDNSLLVIQSCNDNADTVQNVSLSFSKRQISDNTDNLLIELLILCCVGVSIAILIGYATNKSRKSRFADVQSFTDIL